MAASDRFRACNFIEKETQAKMFFVNLAKLLITSFDRMPANDCFLCLSVNFERFFKATLF